MEVSLSSPSTARESYDLTKSTKFERYLQQASPPEPRQESPKKAPVTPEKAPKVEEEEEEEEDDDDDGSESD